MNRYRILSRLSALRRQDGAAVVVSLGLSLAMGVSVTSAVAYSSRNSTSSAQSRSDQLAYALAEAGVNNALAVLANPANDPLNGNLLAPVTSAYAEGTVRWSGTLNIAAGLWSITSTGVVRNPAGGGGTIEKTMKASVPVKPAPPQALSGGAWSYVVATRTDATCDMTLNSSVSAGAPLYVAGDLCLSSGAKVTAGPLVVNGLLTLTARDSSVGSLAAPIGAAHLPGGCKYYNKDFHPICSSIDNVYAQPITQTAPPITVPSANYDTWYERAAPGPAHGCTTASGAVPVFDTNYPIRDRSVPTVFNLTPTTSYTCRVGPDSNPIGELSWNATNRVLTVRGVIYIDGSVKVDNGQVNTYVGRGTLYLSGSYNVTGSTKLCAVVAGTDCDFDSTHWDTNSKLFTVAAGGSGGSGVLAGTGIQIGCYDRHQGPLLTSHAIQFASGAKHQGPVVASSIGLGSSVQIYPFPAIASAPAGLPGLSGAIAVPKSPQLFG